MSVTFRIVRMPCLSWTVRARLKLQRMACRILAHRFGDTGYRICTVAGKPVGDVRECWCGRLWSKGGLLISIGSTDIVTPTEWPLREVEKVFAASCNES